MCVLTCHRELGKSNVGNGRLSKETHTVLYFDYHYPHVLSIHPAPGIMPSNAHSYPHPSKQSYTNDVK